MDATGTRQTKHGSIENEIKRLGDTVAVLIDLLSEIEGNPPEAQKIDKKAQAESFLSLGAFLHSGGERLSIINNTLRETIEKIRGILF